MVFFIWRRAGARPRGHTRRPMIAQTFPSIAKFTDFVQLKDYRQPTRDEYVRYVRKLAEHHRADPATLTED